MSIEGKILLGAALALWTSVEAFGGHLSTPSLARFTILRWLKAL